jgi:probable phosphoglycerate mutase
MPATAPATVIVVRHAQSGHHVTGLTGGWTDTPLTDLGHQQAARAAARLQDELAGVPVRLFTSDLIRCDETAAHIAAALGVAPEFEPRLREHNNGDAAGLTYAEAMRRFPEAFSQLWTQDARPIPGCETWREFYDRVAGFLESLPQEGPVPVLVTHGGTAMNIVRWWLGLDGKVMESAWFSLHPASVTVLCADSWGRRGVDRLNDTGHLAGMTEPLLPRVM